MDDSELKKGSGDNQLSGKSYKVKCLNMCVDTGLEFQILFTYCNIFKLLKW